MSRTDPRPALDALASAHGIPILRFLKDRGWTLASQVAEGLRIHVTTAGKHLAAFHEAGFVERRVHASKKATHAYRLVSPVIRLEFDLVEDRAESADFLDGATAFVDALLAAAHRVGGARLAGGLLEALFHSPDWGLALRDRVGKADNPRAALDALVRDAERACTELVGTATARRLLRMALVVAGEGREDTFPPLRTEVAL